MKKYLEKIWNVLCSPSIGKEENCIQPSQKIKHNVLDDIGVVTNKDHNFVLVNASEKEIILFKCEANLKFLCTVSEEIFALRWNLQMNN